jgi:hypothetical protein
MLKKLRNRYYLYERFMSRITLDFKFLLAADMYRYIEIIQSDISQIKNENQKMSEMVHEGREQNCARATEGRGKRERERIG